MVVDSTIRFNDRMDGPSVSLGSKLSNAKVSFAIFKRDIKRLLVNPVALVVTLGVCVIPSLYAWYNIVANWDPYGNTQGIKIAIANNDRGTQNDLVGELNAGDKVVDQLKENHQLGWTFVDSTADAKEGVESGEYYAAIVIPKNFSDNLVSMLDGNYHQPKLTYYVNEKKSAIAPKVTDTGANTIEEQINSEFVSTVGKTVAGIAKDAGVDLKDKATQTQDSLASSVSEASDTLGEVRDSIGDMNAAIDKTSGAIASADAALAGLQGQAPSLTQAISQGNDLLSEARTTAGNSITSLSKALSEGSLALTKTSASANAAIGKLTGAVTSRPPVSTTRSSLFKRRSTTIRPLSGTWRFSPMTRRQVPRKLTRALYRPSICFESRMKSFRASKTVCPRSRAPWRMTQRLFRVPVTLSITQFIPVRPTLAKPRRTWAKTRCRRPRARSTLLLPFRAT